MWKNDMGFSPRKGTLRNSNGRTVEGTHSCIQQCEVPHLTEINDRKVMIVVMKFA